MELQVSQCPPVLHSQPLIRAMRLMECALDQYNTPCVSTGYYQGTSKFNKGARTGMTIKIGLFCQGVTNVSTGEKNKFILDHNTTSETVFVILLTAGTIFLKFLLVE